MKEQESLTMLQMVAIPVQEIASVPGPWYSTIAPVPPLTVRISATFRIISEDGSATSRRKARGHPYP
jgi:hypothetical protein